MYAYLLYKFVERDHLVDEVLLALTRPRHCSPACSVSYTTLPTAECQDAPSHWRVPIIKAPVAASSPSLWRTNMWFHPRISFEHVWSPANKSCLLQPPDVRSGVSATESQEGNSRRERGGGLVHMTPKSEAHPYELTRSASDSSRESLTNQQEFCLPRDEEGCILYRNLYQPSKDV